MAESPILPPTPNHSLQSHAARNSVNSSQFVQILHFRFSGKIRFFQKMVGKAKKIIGLVAGLALCAGWISAQTLTEKLEVLNGKLESVKQEERKILSQIEELKLEQVRIDLRANGLPVLKPGEKVIEHSAMMLVYDEEHEQARWVAHVIRPEVRDGNVGRSNDFRPDPLVETGSTDEADYFLKTKQADGSYEYDGYGYDRGHLAPSADFRWSEKALSESYFYSNMSPQRPDFNRGIWADLEGAIRGYLERHPGVQLYVTTGPILKPGLPKVERSPNGVSLPEYYYKVIIDLDNQRGIGFMIPNQKAEHSLESFTYTIDRVEEETGLDFFEGVPDVIEEGMESNLEVAEWLPEVSGGDVEPISPADLKRGQVNTIGARAWKDDNRDVEVCGTVVSARTSSKGNILMNLDKKYPNQIFTVFIRKENIPNFSYNPEEELVGSKICVKGNVINLGGVPAMFIENESQLREFGGL